MNTTNAQFDLNKLKSEGNQRNKNATLIKPPNDSYDIAVELCRIFQVSMYCCTHLGDVGVTDFNAVFVGVPENQSQHPIWVAGHEVWHMLQHRHRILVSEFESAEMENILPDAIDQRRFIQDDGAKNFFDQRRGIPTNLNPSPDSKIIKEIFSDVFGNMWCEKEFWHGIRGAHGGIFDDSIDRAIVFLNNHAPILYRPWYKEGHAFIKKLIPLTIKLITP